MRKKIFTIFSLLIVMSMLLTACDLFGGTVKMCGEDEFCVGLVTDVGEIDDKSFNQSSWEGVKLAEQELGAVVNYIETKDAKDYKANMQLFLDNNYDVIVSVGFAIGPDTIEVAKANPDVWFIGIDQGQWEETVPNVTGLIFDEAHSGFLAGVLAGMLTETKTIAAVLGTDLIPPVVFFNKGYIAGAKWVDPDINVISTYHPGGLDVAFTDPEWGAATAGQAIAQGADVVFGAGGKTGNGALEEAAGIPGTYCIGVDSDQWETLPAAHPCLVSSAMKLITPAVIELLTMAKAGTVPAGNFIGGAGLAPFHDFDSSITQEIRDKLADAEAAYMAGEITLPE